MLECLSLSLTLTLCCLSRLFTLEKKIKSRTWNKKEKLTCVGEKCFVEADRLPGWCCACGLQFIVPPHIDTACFHWVCPNFGRLERSFHLEQCSLHCHSLFYSYF